MTDIDRELDLWAQEARWPPTPDVSGVVRARVAPRPAHRPALRRRAALVAALAVGGALTAVSPVGAEIGDLLGLSGGERVVRVPEVPPAQRRLALGRPVTLDAARRAAAFPIVLPRGLGEPDEVRLGGELGRGAVSVRYGDDVVLTQLPGVRTIAVFKQVPRGAEVITVDIGGAPGLWIARGPRAIVLRDARGREVRRAGVLPGAGVLLWDRGRVGLRLETRRGLAAALRIARSAR